MAGQLPLKAPRQNAVGVAAVIDEEPPPVMRERTELAALDQLSGVLDNRRPAIVVSYPVQGTGLARQAGNLRRLAAVAPNRLFAEDVLACLSRQTDHFQVQMIGGRYIHDVDVRMRDDLLPIGRELLETEPLLRFTGASLDFVGTDDQPRANAALMKPVGNRAVGAAVDQPHPSHSNDADTDFFSHASDFQSGRDRFICDFIVFPSQWRGNPDGITAQAAVISKSCRRSTLFAGCEHPAAVRTFGRPREESQLFGIRTPNSSAGWHRCPGRRARSK